MEHLTFDYPARRTIAARTHVGVVGSGDLEVLLSPNPTMQARVIVTTSVDGYGHIWKHVLDRFFSHYDGAVVIEMNDFGATPGVVALRLAEAVEAIDAAGASGAIDETAAAEVAEMGQPGKTVRGAAQGGTQ